MISKIIDLQAVRETKNILADPEMMRQQKGSAQDVKAGKLILLDESALDCCLYSKCKVRVTKGCENCEEVPFF